MNAIAERVADLRAQHRQVLMRALAIVDRPGPVTIEERRFVYECLELADEIYDFARRLQRPKEKWR